jgi:transposase
MSRIIVANTAQLSLVLTDPGAYLPSRHLARFVDNLIEGLELVGILGNCNLNGRRGRSMYDPVMMTKLIMYGYCTGIVSENGIANAVKERFDFNFLAGGRYPDGSTIGKFRRRHLEQLARLSHQILKIAAEANLIDLKVTALDGTKILADASKHKAMSIDRLRSKHQDLKKEINKIKRQLKRVPHQSKKGQELWDELAFKTGRFETIAQAKSDLEERITEENKKKAMEATEERAKARVERMAKRAEKKARKTDRKAKNTSTTVKAKKESKPQINFTDKESRIMKMGNGWGQCYNAQAVVDRKAQIIVAQSVTKDCNDTQQWEPNLAAVGKNLGLMPDLALGDTGYFSEANVTAPTLASTKVLIPPRKKRQDVQPMQPVGRVPKSLSIPDKMRRELQTKTGKELYAMRKSTVEPVFGQIKSAKQQFRQFSFRGLKKVQHEWDLVCAGHNLTKIFSSTWELPDALTQAA